MLKEKEAQHKRNNDSVGESILSSKVEKMYARLTVRPAAPTVETTPILESSQIVEPIPVESIVVRGYPSYYQNDFKNVKGSVGSKQESYAAEAERDQSVHEFKTVTSIPARCKTETDTNAPDESPENSREAEKNLRICIEKQTNLNSKIETIFEKPNEAEEADLLPKFSILLN